MPLEEVIGERCQAYSRWHRPSSISRFLDKRTADGLDLIDLDSVLFLECEKKSRVPIALFEVARDNGKFKPSYLLKSLAERAGVPAYVVQYRVAGSCNPAYPDVPDIDGFGIQQVAPIEGIKKTLSPPDFAKGLVSLRRREIQNQRSRSCSLCSGVIVRAALLCTSCWEWFGDFFNNKAKSSDGCVHCGAHKFLDSHGHCIDCGCFWVEEKDPDWMARRFDGHRIRYRNA